MKLNFRNDHFSLFFKLNFLLTAVLFIAFSVYIPDNGLLPFLLVALALVSSAAILYLLLYLMLYLFQPAGKFVLYLAALLFVIADIGLIVDFFIYRLYKFHINAMVLNIITSVDAADSMQIGVAPVVLFFLFVVALFGFELFMIRKILAAQSSRLAHYNRRINAMVTIPLVLVIMTEKISYGLASLTNKNEILSAFRVVPLYQPLTFNRLAAKVFDYKPDVRVENTIRTDAMIHYPLHPLEVKEVKKFNIFIFASDAVRNSILSEEVSPHIEAFKKDALVFQNHYSGGNATRFGIFSLMYGLNATYWFNFLNAAKGSVLFDHLKHLDYNISIVSSTNTNWPEFRKTCYVDVVESIKDDFAGKPWQKDKAAADYFLNWIDHYEGEKPLFSFLFMDAPHGYSFPPDLNKFHADDENINYIAATKGSTEIRSAFAGYKNAVYFDDILFGKMIAKLKEKGLYDDALIIFTSDHGQEFYEYGSFGHNSAFSEAQTHTPFIMKLPKALQGTLFADTSAMTSHIDVVPTLLHLLGVENPPGDYSNGFDLFCNNFSRKYLFCANWNNNAIITPQYTYVFSNVPNKMFGNEVRLSKNYQKVKEKTDAKLIVEIMNENRKFLR